MTASNLKLQADEFGQFILSKRKINVLVICGSKLSQESGIYTYLENTSDMSWRNYSAIDLATLDAFYTNPALVWLFYAYRRHIALKSTPNNGHKIITKISNYTEKFRSLVISQNMDNLLERSGMNNDSLLRFQGSLFDLKCPSFDCNYKSTNYSDPLTSLLDVTKYSDTASELPVIDKVDDLPICPQCKANTDSNEILRPGVVWFGESLPLHLIDTVDEFVIENGIDLLLLVGTSCNTWPTSSYIDLVKNYNGKIAIFNTEKDDEIAQTAPNTKIWQFTGNCSETLAEVWNPIFKDLNGKV